MPEDRATQELGRRLAKELDSGPDQGSREAVRASFLASVDTMRSRRAGRRRVVFATAAAFAVGFVAAVFWWASAGSDEVEFTLGQHGPAGELGEWVHTSKAQQKEIVFEGGTVISVRGESAVRVVRSDIEEVQINIDGGRVHAEIVSTGKIAWRLRAGPYSVNVVGTSFDVDWESVEARLHVDVSKGVVLVTGAGLDRHGVRLSAGSSLVADRRSGEVSIRTRAEDSSREEVDSEPEEDRADVVPLVDPDADPLIADAGRGETRERGRMSGDNSAGSAASARWLRFFSAGDYKMAVVAARKAGLDSLVSTEGAENLWKLSKAGRFARDSEVARRMLIALRTRFKGKGRAREASFVLGRVALELDSDRGQAARWFETYLSEDPGGKLHEGALGRLIGVYNRLGKTKLARQRASLYLVRYPDGIYFSVARNVLGTSNDD